jgi:hypothetical protein
VGWILGFGIPIAYVLTGLLSSRAVYRSRHKRGLNSNYSDKDDTTFLSVMVAIAWPVFLPICLVVRWYGQWGESLIKRFYNHNLPETDAERGRRLSKEADVARRKELAFKTRIRDLERELGIGEFSKDVNP